jgi:hypothetical protein
MNSLYNNTLGWTFLNEPLYRWGIFFAAVGAMGVAWNGVLHLMREAG